jgi:hypothetical protein
VVTGLETVDEDQVTVTDDAHARVSFPNDGLSTRTGKT